MKILPKKLMRVSDEVVIPVTQYFTHSSFGILGNYGSEYHFINYLCTGTVGTGFFVRDTESHTYRNFCRTYRKAITPSYLNMLLGHEFSFKNEKRLVSNALSQPENDDPLRHRILDSYLNSLSLAQSEEVMERIVAELRKRISGRPNRRLSSPLKHYKNRIAALEREIRLAQLNVKDLCSPEQIDRFADMAKAFYQACTCRRTWDLSVQGDNGHRYKQVFWDLGVFDFIQSPWYLPLLRDGNGIHYYILPNHILRARSSVDFDLIPLKDISVMFHPVGDDVQSDINIPELGLAFRFSNIDRIERFQKALQALIQVQ